MQSIPKRIGAVFCAFGLILMLIASLMFDVSAADESNGSLTLVCKQDDFCIASMQWQIYEIGERRGSSFALTGDFANYPVDLSQITDADKMAEAALTLSNFVVLDMLDPLKIGRTNGSGIVQFNGLEKGLYLAVGTKTKIGEYTYFPSPTIFEIDGSTNKDLNGYPKFYTRKTLPGSKDRFIVRKVWANAEGQIDRPNVLTIGIYKDGELYEEIKLSQENGWTYSWEGAAASDWRVKEISVPPGCYVMYRNNETQYIIMNAYDDGLLARTTTTTTVTTLTTETSTTNYEGGSSTSSSSIKTGDSGDDRRTTASSTTETVTTKSGDSGDDHRTTSISESTATTMKTGFIDSGTKTTSTNPKDTKPGDSTTVISGDTTTTVSGDTSTTDSNGSTIKTTKDNDSTKRTTRNNGTGRVTTTTKDKLPQTGQLWWPVPIMLLGGLVFVAIGLRLIMDSKKED